MSMSIVGNSTDINDTQGGVGGGFNPDKLIFRKKKKKKPGWVSDTLALFAALTPSSRPHIDQIFFHPFLTFVFSLK
jgi:hypothetical protein